MAGGFLGVNQRICPECKATIARDSTTCRFCNAKFNAFGDALTEEQAAEIDTSAPMYRYGNLLVARSGTPFPDRCVKTNAPATRRLKRKLYWHHPALYLMIFFPGLLIYAIVATVVQKKAEFEIPLCDEYFAKRSRDIGIAWGLFAVSILLFVLAAAYGAGFAFAGILCLLASPFYWLAVGNVIRAQKIENDFAHVAGVCPEFLNTLPEWRG